MNFFTTIGAKEIIGLILLIAGALTNFLSKKISNTPKGQYSKKELIVKIIGLVGVVLGFLLILGII